MSKDAPVGLRFSHVYLDKGPPSEDSQRMRRRFLAIASERMGPETMSSVIERELGEQVYGHQVANFVMTCSLADFLDVVTIFSKKIAKMNGKHRGGTYEGFIRDISIMIKEENVGYRIDSDGGMHTLIDLDFERSRISTIRGLNNQRYNAVKHEFESAFVALDASPHDTKLAVRCAFESVEILFKLVCNDSKCQRIGGEEIRRFLRPLIDGLYNSDDVSKNSAGLLLNSMADWVRAHNKTGFGLLGGAWLHLSSPTPCGR